MSEPKTNYDHAHVLLATASAVAAGIPAADAAFLAAVAAIEQHFWSDAEGCARESWNADFTERARPGEELRGQAREDAIIEAARALNDLDIDLLKLEYPGSPEGCRRLAEILDRPWAVLSAGVPFDQFTDIIRIAADEGGASGLIAGRSVWREVVGLAGHHREEFLTSVALPRLGKLVDVAAFRARPWTEVTRRVYPAG